MIFFKGQVLLKTNFLGIDKIFSLGGLFQVMRWLYLWVRPLQLIY